MSRRSERPEWASLVLILGLAGLIVMADNWVVSPILPNIASTFGVPVASTGVLIAAYMLPFGLFQLAYGPLADRYGKFRTVVATLTLFAGVTALGALMPSVQGLTAVRGLTGVFAAATMPVSLALLGDSVPMVDRQKAIGTFMGIAFLGQGISMILGGVIAVAFGWRWVFGLYGLIAAVIAVALWSRMGRFPAVPGASGPVFAPYRSLLGRWRSARVYAVALVDAGISGVALAWVPLLPIEVAAIFGLGAGFMLAHSSILTIATELAAHHRGVAMSLVAFAFMGGGSVGTMLAGRVIDAWGFETYLLGWGLALVLVGFAARFIMSGSGAESATEPMRPLAPATVAVSEE